MTTVGEVVKTLKQMVRKDENLRYLTANEFAQLYGYSPDSVRNLIREGRISRVYKLGNEWLIPEDADISGKQYKKRRGANLIENVTFREKNRGSCYYETHEARK